MKQGLIPIGNYIFNRADVVQIWSEEFLKADWLNRLVSRTWQIKVWSGEYKPTNNSKDIVVVAEFPSEQEAKSFLRQILSLNEALDLDLSSDLYRDWK